MNFEVLRVEPTVWAVGNTYQIMVPVKSQCVMWVKVGNENYLVEQRHIFASDGMIFDGSENIRLTKLGKFRTDNDWSSKGMKYCRT